MAQRQIIDLFCGAGGFSLGAHLAGFHTVVAVDKDATLTSSFAQNFPSSKLVLSDISVLTGKQLLAHAGLTSGRDVGIIGGPPCQGFSLMGKRAATDPRNALLKHYFRLVSEIKPRFFVMENVPGILSGGARTLLNDAIASLSGYSMLGPIKVNASDYGAATNRERIIVIGVRGSKPISEDLLTKKKHSKRSTVADAISDLPSPRKSGQGMYSKKKSISQYALSARTVLDALGASSSQKRTLDGSVSGLLPTAHTTKVVARFSKVKQGTSDAISKCPRLRWDSPAPTLRAGTGSDHGGFQAIRPIHPEQDRVITVREAARIQGFPDWFEFHATKWHSFRMIGNSVSPPLANSILGLIRDSL